MDFETAQRLFNAFDPKEPLRTNAQRRYVQRTESVVAQLQEYLDFRSEHRFLVVGAVGSGKSTELFRAGREFQSDPTRVTLLLDLFEQLMVNALSAGQVVFLVAIALLKTTPSIPPALLRELERAYLGIVRDTPSSTLDVGALVKSLTTYTGAALSLLDPTAGVAVAGIQAGTAALGAVDLRVALPGTGQRLQPNDPRALELGTALRNVVRHVRGQHQDRRLLVLVDGLDKLKDPDQIRDLFCTGVLACLGIEGLDLVYAAPPSLRFDVGYGGGVGFKTLSLDLFNVFKRKDEIIVQNEGPIAQMHDLIIRRIEDADLNPEVILPGHGKLGPIERRIITQSGGLARDLVKIVQRAVMKSVGTGLTAEHFEVGIRDRAREYLYLLNLDREERLHDAWLTKRRPHGDEVDLLLNDNLILCYENGKPWFRPHPMVMDSLRERFKDIVGD